MKILFSQTHSYPFFVQEGSGKTLTDWPSGSAQYVHDLMVTAMNDYGHEVYYLVKTRSGITTPPGIHFVDSYVDNIDIVHLSARSQPEISAYYQSKYIPILATNHLFKPGERPPFKWVHVSNTLAELYNEKQFVWIGLDPDDFIYSDQKEDYFLFMADMSRFQEKGLDIALGLARQQNFRLVVAGSSRQQDHIDQVQSLCDDYDVTYLGDVRGAEKAGLLANARALISPSRLPETFGLVLVEALLSGTPVICSNSGAYGEIMTENVGFVCNSPEDYNHAIDKIETISPYACREYAVANFHYKETTKKYLAIYEEMLMIKNN